MDDIRRGLEHVTFEPLDHDYFLHLFKHFRSVCFNVLALVHDALAVGPPIFLEMCFFEYFFELVVNNHFLKLAWHFFVLLLAVFFSKQILDHFAVSQRMLADSFTDFGRV